MEETKGQVTKKGKSDIEGPQVPYISDSLVRILNQSLDIKM